MRSARGRRRVWRAAKRAAEEARDGDVVLEAQGLAEEAEGRNGEGEEENDRPDSTWCCTCPQ